MKIRWWGVLLLGVLALGGGAYLHRRVHAWAARVEAKRSLDEQTRQVAKTLGDVPAKLRDGDLVFQESTSRQSEMVRALTRSRWTHMGVVFHEGERVLVFEASSPVKTTPLAEWIARGREHLFVVKRLRDADTRLSTEAARKMKALGATWLGRPYDLRFRWDDQALYCSELAYKLFERGLDVRLGKLERAAEMNLGDERVKRALLERFGEHEFRPEETVVTPDAIFHDARLVDVEL